MNFIRHSGNYYLKKIQQGKMTKMAVAQALNVSVYDVSVAYSKYIHSQSPFNERQFNWQSFFEVAISIISTWLVLLTLFEMQQERNTAYAPDVVLETVTTGMVWDDRGVLFSREDYETDSAYTVGEWDDPAIFINTPPTIRIYNIGVGNAKNISIEWNIESDMVDFLDVLRNYGIDGWIDPPRGIEADKTLRFDKEIAGNSGYGLSIDRDGLPFDKIHFDYLLSSAQDSQSISLPGAYYWLMQIFSMLYIDIEESLPFDEYADEYARHTIPPIHLSISYSDIQGIVYKKSIEINASYSLLYGHPDSQGCCSFELIPHETQN